MRKGRRRNPAPLFSARLGVPLHERRAFRSVLYRRGFNELSFPAHTLSVGTGQKPPPAGTQVPPARDPFLNSSGVSAGSPLSLRAHEYLLRTSTASVEQAIPTLPVEPGVTPLPPVNITGVSARRRADDSLLSSNRNGSEPRAPVDPQSMGAERAISGDVSPTRNNAPPPVTARLAPWSALATQCPQRAALRASTIPSESSAPSIFNPTREYSTGNVVLFWQLSSILSQWTASAFVVDDVSYSCAEKFVMAVKGRLFHDHRALQLNTEHVGTPIAQAHRIERPGFRQCHLRTGTRKRRSRWDLCQVFAKPRDETPHFGRW